MNDRIMAFLNKEDFKTSIRTYRLDQIIDDDESVLTNAIAEAVGILINTMTGPGYDTRHIFSRSGSARDQQVVGWGRYIALYKIYERIPDEDVPERIIKNYDDTMELLTKVSDGRLSLNLPRQKDEKGRTKTKFRWGSVPKRSH